MKKVLYQGIIKALNSLGLEIRKTKSSHTFNHTFQRLEALKILGFNPKTIFDVGASNGSWTRQCLNVFPRAEYYLVEPLEENLAGLAKLATEHPNVRYWQGCLGSQNGNIALNVDGDGSSILPGHYGNPYGTQRQVRLSTLDDLIQEQKFPPPDFMKLDVQGYELEVLKGATGLLPHIQAILMEVSFYPFQKGMPQIHEVVGQLSGYGFVVSDIFSLSLRPLDYTAAQTDLFFLRSTHSLRKDHRWDHSSDY